MILAPLVVAASLATCPHQASLGRIAYDAGSARRVLSFADCAVRPAARTPAPPASPVPAAVARKLERIVGPLARQYGLRRFVTPLAVSPDGSWVLWETSIASGSLSADGRPLALTSLATGRTVRLGTALEDPDYRAWCGDTLVFVGGGNRIATLNKRLLIARPPDWRPRPLWDDPKRAFGSVACEPGGRSVAVLSQPEHDTGSFFATRWQLWQVGLDGSRHELDAPPAGWADESPLWSPRGDALLFVRERKGYGRAMLLRNGMLFGPVARLGYSLGFYGHHAWWQGATWHE